MTPINMDELKANWFAPAGSMQERGFLKTLHSAAYLTPADRALVTQLLDEPDDWNSRTHAWWHTAKKDLLKYVPAVAEARQRKLDRDEWYVAYLLTAGYEQPEITEIFSNDVRPLKLRRIQQIVDNIKIKVRDDYEIDDVRLSHVVRWFLGE